MNQIAIAKNNLKTIHVLAPARICLFGDHQDYLGLPVIACAINRQIILIGEPNTTKEFIFNLPDINSKRSFSIYENFENLQADDFFASALRRLRKYGCIPNMGYSITIQGNIPVNAGVSSSSAIVVAWVHFLLKTFGCDREITSEFISQLAYEAEVLEHHSPGGKMDQYTIGIGNIVFIETGNRFNYELIGEKLNGMVLGESGIAKDTIGLLGSSKMNAIKAIHIIQDKESKFVLEKASIKDYDNYKALLPDPLKPYFYAAIQNHIITQKALTAFKNTTLNYPLIGDLMNQHHRILRDDLKLTVPKIDAMVVAAIDAGAFGAKIIGSGGGGCILALCPIHLQDKISIAIKKAGAKDAYPVSVAKGTKMIIDA